MQSWIQQGRQGYVIASFDERGEVACILGHLLYSIEQDSLAHATQPEKDL